MRCVHEASLHDRNCFVTLTYNDKYLPSDHSLRHRDFQLFMKRLRKHYPREKGDGIRFYMCGEYGEEYKRPHYHALLFNFDFPDKKLFKKRRGYPVFISETLSKLWPYGFHEIGSVNFDSAAYVARYIVKKLGSSGDNGREYLIPETGELVQLVPEYTRMSRRGGIGAGWIEKFEHDTYKDDLVVLDGRKMKPARYYDYFHERNDPEHMSLVKYNRKKKAEESKPLTWQREEQIEACMLKKLERLPRNYENGSD